MRKKIISFLSCTSNVFLLSCFLVLLFSCPLVLLNSSLFAKQIDPYESQLDINRASLEDIKTLPITDKQAEEIYYYREYIKFYTSIYELNKLESMDQKTFDKIKPLIKVSFYTDYDETAKRKDEIYYLIRRLASNEGLQEGISDIWEDLLITPMNINKVYYRDILNMPNVSPVDAMAIVKQRKFDRIGSYRDLRHSPGLSHYGATNLKHYITYEDREDNRFYFNYQFKYDTNAYQDEIKEMFQETIYKNYFNLNDNSPEMSHKIRTRVGDKFRFQALIFNKKGEESIKKISDYNDFSKTFAEVKLSFVRSKFILGNYRVAYGQGLVMENTDYYEFRKTGFGFSKRILGITGDISKTEEFALKGSAVEFSNRFLNTSIFYSIDDKDAIVYDSNNNGVLDEDDYVLTYVISRPRFNNDEMEKAESYYDNVDIAPRRDAVREKLLGGHLEFSPLVGTHLGFTAYEAQYNREFVIPYKDSLDRFLIYDSDDYKKLKMPDTEISSLYSTYKSGEYDRNYRRVYGFDWQTVLGSTSFQGEYAELEIDGKISKLGDDPKAVILSNYTQFENLNFLILYRNYDLDFDNPYMRGFSEKKRFEDTIFERYTYVLKNPLLGELYNNSASSQPEEGVYFQTRYQFSRHFTLTKAYLDVWERKCDHRKSVRFQAELDYRPIYQVSLRLKQKLQTNRYDDTQARSVSKTSETTTKARIYLTNRDMLQIAYFYAQTWQPPYTYLTNNAEPNQDYHATGNVLSRADCIVTNYTHNFSDNLRIEGSFLFWNSTGGTIWDWEDTGIDFMGESGMKYWFTIYNRISNNLTVSFKYKVKHYKDRELYYRKWWNDELDEGIDYVPQTKRNDNSFRIQLDWSF